MISTVFYITFYLLEGRVELLPENRDFDKEYADDIALMSDNDEVHRRVLGVDIRPLSNIIALHRPR